jgi:hypothetical protein
MRRCCETYGPAENGCWTGDTFTSRMLPGPGPFYGCNVTNVTDEQIRTDLILLQHGSAEDEERDVEIDDQSRHIDQRSDEWCR